MSTNEATVTAYRVDVVRSGKWWAITVPALDGVFSQTRRLDQVDATAREAIALMLDTDESDVVELDIVVTPAPYVADLVDRANAAVTAAEEANEAATAARYEAAKKLQAEGLPLRDVGRLLGISHQRVSQILAS